MNMGKKSWWLFLSVCVFLGLWVPAGRAQVVRTRVVRAQEGVIHVVQPGENLFRIALYYGTSVDAIQVANGLQDAQIHVGQRLTIPGAQTAEPPATPLTPPDAEAPATPETPSPPEAPPPEAAAAPASSEAGASAYVVQPTDALVAIAARYGLSSWALLQANDLSSRAQIYTGQRLELPGLAEGDLPAEPVADTGDADVADPAPAVPPDTYTVQGGDTLFRIASRFGTTPAALSRLNGIANPAQIYAGEVLRLTGDAPPPGAGTGTGRRIVVDLSEQHLYAYEGERLVYSFVASTGAAPYVTRTGEFRVQSKIPRAYGSAWNIWMPSWLGIYWAGSTENGIHALPVTPGGQVLWGGALGSPVSFGCVVLGTYEAQLLYDWAVIGTPVLIQF